MSSDSGGDSEETDEDGQSEKRGGKRNGMVFPTKTIKGVKEQTMDRSETGNSGDSELISDVQENDTVLKDENEVGGESPATEKKLPTPEDSEAADTEDDIEDPVEDPLLQAGLAEAGDYYAATPTSVYESTTYAQAPKLEPIAEHEILELETPATASSVTPQVALGSPSGDEDSTLASSPMFSADGEASSLLPVDFTIGAGTDRSQSPMGRADLEYLNLDPDVHLLRQLAPHMSDSALPKNYTEPSGLGSVIRQVGSFVGRRIFGSTAVTPSDSLQSLDFGGPSGGPVLIGGGSSRFFRAGYSSRNSVSSDTSALPLHTSSQGWIKRKRSEEVRRMAGPTGQMVSRSKRFLTKGTAGFLHAKGTSAISLRPADTAQGLPSPCGECPHCRKFLKLGEPGIPLRPLGQPCPCRICTILEENTPGAPTRLGNQGVTRGKTIGGLGRQGTTNAGDYGIFCDACSQSGTIDGRCSRFSVGGSYYNGPPVQPTVVVGGVKNQTADQSVQSSMESLVRQSSMREQACQASRQVSMTSLGTCGSMCRICHSLTDKDEPLIAPCRCLGTLKYVHMSCLVQWLDISCRKLRKPPQCELCGYRYQRHKMLKLKNCSWPSCSTKDMILHVVFVISVITMIVCAGVTIICFKADSGRQQDPHQPVELTAQEVVTLICGIMFFCGFFVAMYVQVKATVTLYKLVTKFWQINHEWQIDEYRPSADLDWIKKNRLIREQLAAASAAANANAGPSSARETEEEQREPFLRLSGEDGSDIPGVSRSISRRSSSSLDLEIKELERREQERETDEVDNKKGIV